MFVALLGSRVVPLPWREKPKTSMRMSILLNTRDNTKTGGRSWSQTMQHSYWWSFDDRPKRVENHRLFFRSSESSYVHTMSIITSNPHRKPRKSSQGSSSSAFRQISSVSRTIGWTVMTHHQQLMTCACSHVREKTPRSSQLMQPTRRHRGRILVPERWGMSLASLFMYLTSEQDVCLWLCLCVHYGLPSTDLLLETMVGFRFINFTCPAEIQKIDWWVKALISIDPRNDEWIGMITMMSLDDMGSVGTFECQVYFCTILISFKVKPA